MAAAAVAAFVAGCGENEAKKFGYKGADLADEEMMFFSTGPSVTNWVPARVLNVFEEYPISPEETALIKAAGVVEPGAPLAKIPEGYEKFADEPWFVTWTKKDVENFGKKGVNGFVSHYDESKKVWETSETYFSSYYDDETGALAALADIRKAVADGFSPKRFYDFDKCWVAEYLRIRVMCLVGQKPDGKWSCMLDIQDKNRSGCGQWEPLDAQEERLAAHNYRKALVEWKAAKAKVVADNHAAVEKARAERGIELFGDPSGKFETSEGGTAYQRLGAKPASEVTNREVFWKERVAAISKATGVAFNGEPTKQDDPSGFAIWYVVASSDIYDARLDVAFPPVKVEEPAQNPQEGEEPAPKPQVQWRELCFEKVLPGFEVPPRPQPPKR
jgi:hypothetical protein